MTEDPCGVAGIKLTVGGRRGSTEGAEAGKGTGSGTAAIVAATSCTSEGVVQVSATEDGMPKSALSSSIGISRRGNRDVDQMWEGPAAGAGVICLLSGMSRKMSSIQIRPRKDSSAPVNRCMSPSIQSNRWLVLVDSAATILKVLTRALSTAIRFSCSMYLKSEKKKKQ